jgi:hypothetical protein
VHVLAFVASNHEVCTGSNGFFTQNLMASHVITGWTLGGVVKDFFFLFQHFVL